MEIMFLGFCPAVCNIIESDASDDMFAQYVKSWFWLDILSSIPVDYIFLILDSGILDTEEVEVQFSLCQDAVQSVRQQFKLLLFYVFRSNQQSQIKRNLFCNFFITFSCIINVFGGKY